MEALFISFFTVATAEIGDKTQLLALCLATRFRKPVPIILGIFAATLGNHLLSGFVGQYLSGLLTDRILHILLALSFFSAAIWALIPDKIDGCDNVKDWRGIFMTTCITFFVAEMGDKTQLATVALAAQFQSLAAVVTGTTLGMMAANVPAVLFSNAIANKIPLRLVRTLSALIFAGLGMYELTKLG